MQFLVWKIVGIDFNFGLQSINFRPKVQLNNHKISFGNTIIPNDSFQRTSVEKFFDENYIKTSISQNQEIKNILNKHNIPLKLNMEELKDIQSHHCKDTQEIASGIVKNLPPALKQNANIRYIKDAAILHDFGKVLIPAQILNKKGSLTPQEHEIMDLHTTLGYELLKNSGIDNEILNLVKNHHKDGFTTNINQKILNIADKYSALTENRVYKTAYTPKQALTILLKEVQQGNIDPVIFNALVKSVSDTSANNKLHTS